MCAEGHALPSNGFQANGGKLSRKQSKGNTLEGSTPSVSAQGRYGQVVG